MGGLGCFNGHQNDGASDLATVRLYAVLLWFSIFLFNVISPVIKKIFINRVLSIIILRLISIALLWCQYRCSSMVPVSMFCFDRVLDFYS